MNGSGGRNVGKILLIVATLGLLAISFVPTRVVASRARLEPARVALVKISLAAAGASVGVGYCVMLLLSKAS